MKFAKPMKPKHRSVNPVGHRERMKAHGEEQRIRLLKELFEAQGVDATIYEEEDVQS